MQKYVFSPHLKTKNTLADLCLYAKQYGVTEEEIVAAFSQLEHDGFVVTFEALPESEEGDHAVMVSGNRVPLDAKEVTALEALVKRMKASVLISLPRPRKKK